MPPKMPPFHGFQSSKVSRVLPVRLIEPAREFACKGSRMALIAHKIEVREACMTGDVNKIYRIVFI